MQVLLSSVIIISCSGCIHLLVIGTMEKAYEIHKHNKLKERIQKLEDQINRDPNLL